MNRTFLDIFSTTKIPNTTMATTQQTTTTTATPKTTSANPLINVIADNEEIIDEIKTVQDFLIILTLLVAFVVIFKLIKLCKKGYNMHNERVIMRAQNSSERL